MVEMGDILPSVLNLVILFLMLVVVVPAGKFIVNQWGHMLPSGFRALVNAI